MSIQAVSNQGFARERICCFGKDFVPLIIASLPTYVNSCRYKRVIAVVGFNPNKKYQVTPDQRKDLLEKMLQNTEATNIDVAGADLFVLYAMMCICWSKQGIFFDLTLFVCYL
jgi:hypothetical protein